MPQISPIFHFDRVNYDLIGGLLCVNDLNRKNVHVAKFSQTSWTQSLFSFLPTQVQVLQNWSCLIGKCQIDKNHKDSLFFNDLPT